jgi:hypothetical protein
VTTDMLTSLLAQRVLGWTVAPDRFLMGDRRWMPRWRFQPEKRLEDAGRLLSAAAPQEYTVSTTEHGAFWVKVRIAGRTGEACDSCQPRAITLAVARALRLEVDE